MRKILALLATCLYLMQAGGALAASYEACCEEDCKALQCASVGCLWCSTAATTVAAPDSPRLRVRHGVPIWTDAGFTDPAQQVWRPPD